MAAQHHNATNDPQGDMAVKALPTKDLILCQEGENSIKELKDRLQDLGGHKKPPEQEQTLDQGESLFSIGPMAGITGSKRMTAEDRMANEGVERRHVKKYLRKELAEANSCLNLPFAFGAFLFFILGTTAHLRLEELHAADLSATFDIMENVNFAFSGSAPYENGRMGHKTILDVNTYADYWSWFTLGITPIFFPEGWDVSETRANTLAICQTFKEGIVNFGWNDSAVEGVNDEEGIFGSIGTSCPEGEDMPARPDDYYGGPFSPTYLWYNPIVGGLRMRQEYQDPVACINEDYRGKVYTGQCTPDNGYELMPDLWRAMYTDDSKTNNSEAPPVYFKSGTPQTEIRKKARELENQVWFSPYTSKIELLYTTYNPHGHSFTATFIYIFQNRAGHFHKIVEPISWWLEPYPHWYNWFYDIAWALFIVKMFIEESIEICRYCRQFGHRGIVKYCTFLNLLDWFNIAYAIAIVIVWVNVVNETYEHVEILETADAHTVGSFATDEELVEFFKHTTTLAIRFQELKRVLSFYPFVLVTAFLKQFANQQRLAMFTTTLVSASVDICHFGVVWFTLFLLWVISAMLLFGQEIEEFASFERATMAVFRTLHGDFDWDQLNRVGRLEGMLWFWTYHILVFFIMTNMLLAIVMDWYAEVKGSVGSDAETLWSQVNEIFQRRRAIMKGDALPMKLILQKLDPTDLDSEDDLDDGERLTISKFRKEVDGLRYKQAYEILQASQGDLDALERDGTSIAATNQRVYEMDEVLSNLYINLQREKIYFERVQEQQDLHAQSEHRRHGVGHSPSARRGQVGHEQSTGTGSRGGHSFAGTLSATTAARTPSEGGAHGGQSHGDRAGHTPHPRPQFSPPPRFN